MQQMFINGDFTSGAAVEHIEVRNPATEEMLDTVPRGTAQDAQAAVSAPMNIAEGSPRLLRWRHGGTQRIGVLYPPIATPEIH
jgi:acyl-CoA reductase-like NAD-dependent aldehyde dehydrogenase